VRWLGASIVVAGLPSMGCSDESSDDSHSSQEIETKTTTETETAQAQQGGAGPGNPSQPEDRTVREQTQPDNISTELSFKIGDDERKGAASARLQVELDGTIQFSAQSSKLPNEMFSLRLVVDSHDVPLPEATFELVPGLPRKNEITVVRGELPDATSLHAIGGEVHFESFSHDAFELSFDVQLSEDPRGAPDTPRAVGTLKGGAQVVCVKKAAASDAGGTDSSSGGTATTLSSWDDPECRASLGRLISE